MIKSCNIHFSLNKFLKKIVLKKEYLKALKNKIYLLSNVKKRNYKEALRRSSSVSYTIDISFSKVNILLHITDFSGKLKFSSSAGSLSHKGKSKKVRILIIKSMINLLLKNCSFLQSKPIALHLKNVKFLKRWIVRKFKKKFFIQTVKSFSIYSYNGCRKKKIRRKKIKK